MMTRTTLVVAALLAVLGGGRPAAAIDCVADMNGDGVVDTDDLIAVILGWGVCPPPCPGECSGDVDSDCVVDSDDLITLLLSWGPCPVGLGACCLSDGTCAAESELGCAELGGVSFGEGTVCATHVCPTAQPVDELTVVTGELISGDAGTLNASDNLRVRVRSVSDGGMQRTELRTTHSGSEPPFGTAPITRLDLVVEASATQAGVEAKVYLRNFAEGAWDLVDSFTLTSSDVWHETSDVANPNDYLNDDGLIKLRLVTAAPSGIYIARTDFVAIMLSTVLGACCLPEGGCVLLTGPDCEAAGGQHEGDGVDCLGVACPPFLGACCLPNGVCVETGTADCAVQDGVFAGDGVPCGAVNCPIVADPVDFQVITGERLGGTLQSLRDSDNDRMNIRSTPSGGQEVTRLRTTHQAASNGPVSAIGLTVEASANANGVSMQIELRDYVAAAWHVLDTVQLTTTDGTWTFPEIPQPARYVNGEGEARVRLVTTRDGDQYVARTDLVEVMIATVRGACCMPAGGCVLSAEEDCLETGGAYQGDDVECADANCAAFAGACCLADERCIETTYSQCLAEDGLFAGDGVSCAAADCPVAIELIDYEVVFGTQLDGSLDSLRASDGDRVALRSVFAGGDEVTQLRTHHQSDSSGEVVSIGLAVEASANFDDVMLSIYLRDVEASAWELLDEVQLATADATWTFADLPDPARFVDDQRRVHVRLVTRRTGAPYTARTDLVEVVLATVRGACCVPEGGCALLAEADCVEAGGDFLGDDVGCVDADCR